ncbi:tetratricopeptide repeat protein [Burkholderia alba]|uniref:tetratricopeptide repeat protein n=1 Tax=Burkholderia alba TaxID=2683677 RepID=UPI002B05C303|nr:tetratricopeptide repeat protein [Burkholderia alba]
MSTPFARAERARLVSPWAVALFAALMAALLALAFPRERLQTRLLEGHDADTLTIAYLEAWRTIEPDNGEVLAELAREYLTAQRLADARPALAVLVASRDAALRRRGRLMSIELAEIDAYQLAPDVSERARRLRVLQAQLTDALRDPWEAAQLEQLQRKALALNDAPLAARYCERLADAQPGEAPRWLAQAGRLALAASDHRLAAERFFAAQRAAASPADARRYFLSAVQALQSGGAASDALRAAEQHLPQRLADDPQVLRYLATLALAARAPDDAQRYARRLLRMARADGAGPRVANGHAARAARPRLVRVTSDPPLSPARAGRPTTSVAPYRDSGPPGQSMAKRGVRAAPAVARAGPPSHGVLRAATRAEPRPRPVAPPRARAVTPRAVPSLRATGIPALPSRFAPTDMARYEATDYDLAYRVFLANGDLARAQRVAQSAVDQAPDALEWRERLARTAEWNGAPNVALAQYVALAQRRDGAADWASVKRLAPALNDNRALLAAALRDAAAAPDDLSAVDRVVALQERLGDPDAALRFLSERARGARRQALLERSAALALRKGDDPAALAAYETLNREYGPAPAYALQIGLALYTRAAFAQALAVLDAARSAATPADDTFWRFYTQLAGLTGRSDSARTGYAALVAGAHASADDIAAMVALYDDRPLDAGRLAEFGYRRSGRVRLLEQALIYYTRAQAPARGTALLASLTPAERRDADRSAGVRVARAQARLGQGDGRAALADLRAAAELSPGDTQVRAARVWALTESGSDAELRDALARGARDAQGDAQLWSAYAAGYLRLNDGRAAVHYLRKEAGERRGDPLWLLSYAEALELAGRPDAAWRVRRAVWRQTLAPESVSAPRLTARERDALRARLVGLVDEFQGGDASRGALIALLREDLNEPADDALGDLAGLPDATQARLTRRARIHSALAREVALAWARNHDADDMERAWLLARFLKGAGRPVYAELTLALAQGDAATLDRLLDTAAAWLPLQTRIEAEARAGRYAAAQSDAFDLQTRLPRDDAADALARDQLLRTAQAIAPSFRYVDQGGFRYAESGVSGGVRWSPSLSLGLAFLSRSQHSDDTMPNVPRRDSTLTASVRALGADRSMQWSVGYRDGVARIVTARVDGTWRAARPLSFYYALAMNAPAIETAQLLVGGMKHLASLGVQYQGGAHLFAGARFEYARFYGQDHSLLGAGSVVDLTAGYKLFADYPDYTVRAVLTHGQYSNAAGMPGTAIRRLLPGGVAATSAAFMPQSFTQAGLLFSFGDAVVGGDALAGGDAARADSYAKGWRPFLSAGPIVDSRQGWAAQVALGATGSVAGNDQATLYFEHQGVSSNHATPVTEYGVRYRWMY